MTWVLLLFLGTANPVKVTGYASERDCKFAKSFAEKAIAESHGYCIPGPTGKAQE